MREKAAAAGIYGLLHFLVDFCCAFFIFRMMRDTGELYLYFFIYNFCAFALQMPAGLLADKCSENAWTAMLGCFLTAAAPFLYTVLSYGKGDMSLPFCISAIVLTGLGNCLFHVGGGIEILKTGRDKLWPLGIFVSPGAAGIFLGNCIGKGDTHPSLLPYVLLVAGTFILLWQQKERKGKVFLNHTDKEKTAGENFHYKRNIAAAAIFCLAAVVVLRSHLGMIYSFPWKKETIGGICSLFAVMSGKVAGGMLADRFGIGKTAFVSMAVAMGCFFLAENMGFGVIGIFCFNMSMPLTLYLSSRLLNPHRGFAFGILTFAIFIGFLPSYFGYHKNTPGRLVIYSLASLIFLTAGYLLMKGGEHPDECTGP